MTRWAACRAGVARGSLIALCLGLVASACSGDGSSGSGGVVTGLGDPEPAASVAPLEVVLDTCTLNRDTVAPGEHEVALVGTGTVVITDPAGATVATLSQSGSLKTSAGRYTFTCQSAGAETGKATLTS